MRQWVAFTALDREPNESDVEFVWRVRDETKRVEAMGYEACYQYLLGKRDAVVLCLADENGCFIRA